MIIVLKNDKNNDVVDNAFNYYCEIVVYQYIVDIYNTYKDDNTDFLLMIMTFMFQ